MASLIGEGELPPAPARLAPVHGEDVEAEAGLHELRVEPGVGPVEQRLLELAIDQPAQ